MIGLLIIVAATALLGVLLWIFDGRKHHKENIVEEVKKKNTAASNDEECCGMHIVCEKSSLSPVSSSIEYYDDEELDRFRGKEDNDYSDDEIEEWRDILITLRAEDIAGWARSIQLRELTMPQVIRDELLMIVAEERERLEKEK